MTVDTVFVLAEPVQSALELTLTCGGLVGFVSTITICVLGATGKVSNRSGAVAFGLSAVTSAALLLAGNSIQNENDTDPVEQVNVWLSEEYDLTVADQWLNEDVEAPGGLLGGGVILVTDEDGDVQAVQMLPVEDEAGSSGEQFFLADPETGEEFTAGSGEEQ